jgi:hypothetical protein
MQLKDWSTAFLNALLSILGLIAASVVINPSIVAIFGATIPEPFAHPAMVTFLPPNVIVTTISFVFKSVVNIDRAILLDPVTLNPFTSFGAAF